MNKASALAGRGYSFLQLHPVKLKRGDGRNDIELLRWAGRGVAIGDAPDEVQQAAARGDGHLRPGRPRNREGSHGSAEIGRVPVVAVVAGVATDNIPPLRSRFGARPAAVA